MFSDTVALLCMNVNWSERKQGSGPEEKKVLQNIGGLLFAVSGLKSVLSGLKSALLGLREMDGQMDRGTNERKSPCVLHKFVPFRAAAQKK